MTEQTNNLRTTPTTANHPTISVLWQRVNPQWMCVGAHRCDRPTDPTHENKPNKNQLASSIAG